MLSAFLIALREGVEASLVVGIILVYLSRTGRAHLARFAWYGVAAAVALSLGIAIALERFQISEDGFEGVMLLVAAAFVVTMIVWMNRVARHLKKEIESKVEAYAAKAGDAAGWGIFLFVFLMVVREGAELGPDPPGRGAFDGWVADLDRHADGYRGGGRRRGLLL